MSLRSYDDHKDTDEADAKSKEEGGLGCPYIAKVHDFGEYNNVSDKFENHSEGVYGILEKLPMDLYKRATTEGNIFTENDLKSMTTQLLMALSCMHENNIYHFDINPCNIMMCDDGNENVKLIDFGMCYTYDENDPTNEELGLRGAPTYYSPGFIFRPENEMDNIPFPIDDLWSLAVTICLIFEHNSDYIIIELFEYTIKNTKISRSILIPVFQPKHKTLGRKEWRDMPESIRFCKRIFDTVTVKGEEIQPNKTFFTLTAADLLKDPWFKEVKGGKTKRKRKIKNKRKTKRGKSKRKRKN